jgi:hypothetical protein
MMGGEDDGAERFNGPKCYCRVCAYVNEMAGLCWRVMLAEFNGRKAAARACVRAMR